MENRGKRKQGYFSNKIKTVKTNSIKPLKLKKYSKLREIHRFKVQRLGFVNNFISSYARPVGLRVNENLQDAPVQDKVRVTFHLD